MRSPAPTFAPPSPRRRLSLGVTGHRESNPAFAAHRAAATAALEEAFDLFQQALEDHGLDLAPTRLHTLLADGADQLAADGAIARSWELVAPLPFGRDLNTALNARPATLEDGRALLEGGDAADPHTQARGAAIRTLTGAARLFEMAERDAAITERFLAHLAAPRDTAKAVILDAAVSERVALAARVLIEQSDILIALWDEADRAFVGGTGHTIVAALALGTPVLWIDVRAPETWRLLRTPESLAVPPSALASREDRWAAITTLVENALEPADGDGAGHQSGGGAIARAHAMGQEAWRPHSHPLSHAYRRIEALFGPDGRPFRNLRLTYEAPDAMETGSGAAVLEALKQLPGGDVELVDAVRASVLRRFAWADGVSSRLSDVYRGGMTASFILSAAAIISGVAYLPFVDGANKGGFATVEFLILAAILGVTWMGQRQRWHGRWFETRRVAEYFRHSPILLALGVARAPGRWPKGTETSWPEWYARHGLREVGLPRVALTTPYLRAALETLLDDHIVRQRDYHAAKARRLTTVHQNLDRISEAAFVMAVVSVATFLLLALAAALGWVGHETLHGLSKWFTLLGVVLPTLGASIAGVRYFGDFERFAAISKATQERLDVAHSRVALLLAGPAEALDYAGVSDLAHAADDIVISEIESWQSVFGGKHVTVPV